MELGRPSYNKRAPVVSCEGMADDEAAQDARREAALASTPLFHPNFKPSKATQAQLDKLKELHRKRLQIKSRDKGKPKAKGNAQKSVKANEDVDEKNSASGSSISVDGCSDVSALNQSACLDQNALSLLPTKRRKLHWGLDAKERWERKANM